MICTIWLIRIMSNHIDILTGGICGDDCERCNGERFKRNDCPIDQTEIACSQYGTIQTDNAVQNITHYIRSVFQFSDLVWQRTQKHCLNQRFLRPCIIWIGLSIVLALFSFYIGRHEICREFCAPNLITTLVGSVCGFWLTYRSFSRSISLLLACFLIEIYSPLVLQNVVRRTKMNYCINKAIDSILRLSTHARTDNYTVQHKVEIIISNIYQLTINYILFIYHTHF